MEEVEPRCLPAAVPASPFWPLLFRNARIHLVGSADVFQDAKAAAAAALNEALDDGWRGLALAECLPLEEIARAHELVEQHASRGSVVIVL